MWTLSAGTGAAILHLHLNAGGDHQNRSKRPSARKLPRVHADREEGPRGWWLHATKWGENGDTHRGEDYQGRCGEKNSVAHLFLMRPSAILRRRLLTRPVADVTTNCTYHQGCVTFFFSFLLCIMIAILSQIFMTLIWCKSKHNKKWMVLGTTLTHKLWSKKETLVFNWTATLNMKTSIFFPLINIHIHTNFEHVFLCVYYD